MEKKLTGSNNFIDQKDLKRSLDTIGKNWMWFVLFLALGISGSIAYLYKATKYNTGVLNGTTILLSGCCKTQNYSKNPY